MTWDDPNHEVLEDLVDAKRSWRENHRYNFDFFIRGCVNLTPIFCFRVNDLEFWTQDYVGNRLLVATCPDEKQLTWLVNSMTVFHKTQVLQWDDPDSKVN